MLIHLILRNQGLLTMKLTKQLLYLIKIHYLIVLHYASQFIYFEFQIILMSLLEKLTAMSNDLLRAVRVTSAIFLAKLRLELSNRVLAYLFRLASKRSVSHTCHQVRVALMQDFVPNHVGFQHVSRETILAQHQTEMATELLTNGPYQVGLIVDGTYFFCQKSSNSKFQRRTYSQHKRRHLVKPMIITASVSI